MPEIHWQPYFPPLPVVLGALLLVALATLVYWRSFSDRPRLSVSMYVMRLLLILAITVLLFGPSFVPPSDTEPRRPSLVVMLDTSASMQTEDVDGQARFEFAAQKWLGESQLERLQERADVDLLAFDESVRSMNASTLARGAKEVATGTVSNIAQSVRETLGSLESGEAAWGTTMLLMTDGRDSGAESFQPAALQALAKSVPVHTVALGGANLVRDLAVVALPMQDYLLAGEEGEIVVKVLQTGCGNLSAKLRLRAGEDVQSRTIEFRGRSSVEISFAVKQERRGLYEYVAEVEALQGEVEERNNQQSTFLEVTDEQFRVLLVEGQPFWDTKFIAQSLRKDARIELTHVTQVNSLKQQQILTRAKETQIDLPQSLEDLSRYDVIILGTAIENVLEPQVIEALPEFVGAHGGRLVFARGRAYDTSTPEGVDAAVALSVLEPVVWGPGVLRDTRIALEPAGRTHPIFALTDEPGGIVAAVNELPAWSVLPVVAREKVLTKVLARVGAGSEARLTSGKGQAAVAVMEYERGLVTAILGEGLWRWRILPKDKRHLSGSFDRFWSNMVRWLAMGSDYRPGEALALHLSRKSVQLGDSVRMDAICRFSAGEEFDAGLTVVDPEGGRHSLALHDVADSTVRRQAEFTPKVGGVHTVIVEAPSLTPEPVEAKFNAYDVDAERIHCGARPQPLQFLSEASGGRFLSKDSPETLVEILRQQEAAMQVPPQLRYLWDQAWILVLVLMWSGLEWLIRKKGGLL